MPAQPYFKISYITIKLGSPFCFHIFHFISKYLILLLNSFPVSTGIVTVLFQNILYYY